MNYRFNIRIAFNFESILQLCTTTPSFCDTLDFFSIIFYFLLTQWMLWNVDDLKQVNKSLTSVIKALYNGDSSICPNKFKIIRFFSLAPRNGWLVSITMQYINNTRCFMIARDGFGFSENVSADGLKICFYFLNMPPNGRVTIKHYNMSFG